MALVAKGQRRGTLLTAVMLALCLAISLMAGTTAKAHADNRDWLRPDATGQCDWDGVQYWVQRCDVWSPAMGRNIPVMIQPAQRGGNAGLYLLDGMRATNDVNAWATSTDAIKIYEPHNITLVMPIGGAGSFYTDWVGNASLDPRRVITYKWETFLTSELPAYLQQNFGVAPNNNSIAGLSMGGTAAMNLAANHVEQFKQVMSFSGFLTMTLPGVYTLLGLGMIDVGMFNITQMYSSIISPRRFQDDPLWNMDKLRNAHTSIYISAASGIPAVGSSGDPGGTAAGMLLEAGSLLTTRMWGVKARLTGVQYTADYPALGIHNWPEWNSQIYKTKNFVLDRMNAW